ncbi:MAG: hypothetical protein GF346_01395 [Candidatus Eisenbacteria bacterium]|nr:hypothetical protein [Candidatus Latescibacterota bacterium]MBD3301085.1 hypothetical protein [Candidatus Eisenbacteria bacterium]
MEIRNGPGAFDSLSTEGKKSFLETIGDKEVLLQLAREDEDELLRPYEHAYQDALDGQLIRVLEHEETSWIAADTVGAEEYLPAYRKEYLVHWVMHPEDSLVTLAREQVLAGRPFAEVAAEFSMADSAVEKGGSLGWIRPTRIPLDFIEEIVLGYEGPGQVSSIKKIPYGYTFYKMGESRPFDLESDPEALRGTLRMIRDLRIRNRLEAFADSLLDAGGFELREENVPLLTERMSAFWDTLMVDEDLREKTRTTFEPPTWFFSEETKALPLYTYEGETVTIGAYLDGLAEAPPKMWPSMPDAEGVAKQIRDRVLLDKELRLARKQGLHETESFRAFEKLTRERMWIEQYQQETIRPQVEVTDEEIQAFYDERRDSYVMGDRIKLNYCVFPTRQGAREFYDKVEGKIAEVFAEESIRLDRQGELLNRVVGTPYYDYEQPLPDSLRPVLELGRDADISDVLPPAKLPSGGWAVARVILREKPGVKTLDEVRVGIERILQRQEFEALINQKIEEGRERFGLTLYPERLEQTEETAEAGS